MDGCRGTPPAWKTSIKMMIALYVLIERIMKCTCNYFQCPVIYVSVTSMNRQLFRPTRDKEHNGREGLNSEVTNVVEPKRVADRNWTHCTLHSKKSVNYKRDSYANESVWGMRGWWRAFQLKFGWIHQSPRQCTCRYLEWSGNPIIITLIITAAACLSPFGFKV